MVNKIIGHKTPYETLGKWLSKFNSENFKAVIISGPPGIGHTILTEFIANKFKYKLISYDCCDLKVVKPKTKSEIDNNITYISDIEPIIVQKSFFVSNIFCFETGDVISGSLITSIGSLIDKTKNPIIINCNDSYHLKSLTKKCLEISLKRPSKTSISKLLLEKKLIKKTANLPRIEKMIEGQGNDIRHIITSLKIGMKPDKDINGRFNLFTATSTIFNKKASLNKREQAFWEDYSMIPLMVQQNYISPNSNIGDISFAADTLSILDISEKYAGNKTWSLLPINAYLTIGSAKLSRTKISPFPGPKFSEYLGKNSTQRSKKNKLDEIKTKFPEKRENLSFLYEIFVIYVNSKKLKEAFDLLNAYNLSRDDMIETIGSMSLNGIGTSIGSKQKSAFTRYYKKQSAHLLKI